MMKSDAAFRTIGEVSEMLGVPQHVLRYWETRFSQLRPITRAGNRRYYRPEDIALARRIHRLLGQEGYTVRGVQKLLSTRGPVTESGLGSEMSVTAAAPSSLPIAELKIIRALLADALAE